MSAETEALRLITISVMTDFCLGDSEGLLEWAQWCRDVAAAGYCGNDEKVAELGERLNETTAFSLNTGAPGEWPDEFPG